MRLARRGPRNEAGVKGLRAVRISEQEHFKELGTVRPENGSITLDSAAESLVTRTTADDRPLPSP